MPSIFFANFRQDSRHVFLDIGKLVLYWVIFTLHLALIRAHLAPHLLNLSTHCIVFGVVSLLQRLALLIDSSSQIKNILLDFFAHVCKLAFDQAVGIVDFASPRVRLAVNSLLIFTALGLNDVQEYFWLTVDLFRSNDILHRSKDLKPVLQRESGPLFDNFFKRVGHDGNEHVQESNLRNQYCQGEESIAQEWIGMPNEALNIEFSNHEFELAQSWVKHEVLEDWLHDDIFFATDCIKLEHVHCIANVD